MRSLRSPVDRPLGAQGRVVGQQPDRTGADARPPGVSAVRIPETDGLPHFEKLPEVRAALDTFWQGLER